MLVAVLVAFCGAVAGYFSWATSGFSIALTSSSLLFEAPALFSIAKTTEVVSVVLCTCSYLLVNYKKKCKRNESSRHVVLSVVFALLVGWWWAYMAHSHFLKVRISAPDTLNVRGVITGLPEVKDGQVTFLLQPVSTTEHSATSREVESVWGPEAGGGKWPLRVIWYQPQKHIEPGQLWEFPLSVRPSDSLAVSGIGFVRNSKELPQYLGDRGSYHSYRYHLKQQLLTVSVPDQQVEEYQTTALLLALLLGDRSALTVNDWLLFGDTGTTHLIAISGLHIGLVASLAYFITFNGLRISRFAIPKVSVINTSFVMTLIAAWSYAALAGYSVPTQRACLTVTVVVILRMLFPVLNVWFAVLTSAAVILLFDPTAIVSASFWLTFMAVVFIFFVVQGRVGRFHPVTSWGRVQLALFVGLLPLSIWFFGKVSLVSVLANLIAVPVVGWLIVPLSFLYAVLVSGLGAESGVPCMIFEILGLLVSLLFDGLGFLQSWEAALSFPKPSMLAVMFAMFGAMVLCLPRAVPGKWVALLMFVPLFLTDSQGAHTKRISRLGGDHLLIAIDQGDSVVLVGSREQHARSIQLLVGRYLRQRGIRDMLVEPVFSLYRQWISGEYFVLNIQVQSGRLLQRSAVALESLSACNEKVIDVNGLNIESLISIEGDRCQLLISDNWGRYLLLDPGGIQQQLLFLDENKQRLVAHELEGMLVDGFSPLSGALLNIAAPKAVMYWGEQALDLNTVERLLSRGIDVVR